MNGSRNPLILACGAAQVTPIFLAAEDYPALCTRPYPGHPHGCPNFAYKLGCPPNTLIDEDLHGWRDVWVLWTIFDLAAQRGRMRAAHPEWTDRQCENSRYWQAGARKELLFHARRWKNAAPRGKALRWCFCPEAHGVNVTATMAAVGETLEWPPEVKTYQVALAGTASV